jgi:hypothetical protein
MAPKMVQSTRLGRLAELGGRPTAVVCRPQAKALRGPAICIGGMIERRRPPSTPRRGGGRRGVAMQSPPPGTRREKLNLTRRRGGGEMRRARGEEKVAALLRWINNGPHAPGRNGRAPSGGRALVREHLRQAGFALQLTTPGRNPIQSFKLFGAAARLELGLCRRRCGWAHSRARARQATAAALLDALDSNQCSGAG